MKSSEENRDHAEGSSDITRREMARNLVALGLSLGAMEAAAQSGGGSTETLSADCKKVLLERIANTTVVVNEDGSFDMLAEHATWPGDGSSAYHQDWLFNSVDGFKVNPKAALEKTLWEGTETARTGATPGDATQKLQQILALSDELGLLDSDNLIYQAIRDKCYWVKRYARTDSVMGFVGWLSENAYFPEATITTLQAKATEFASQPATMQDGDY